MGKAGQAREDLGSHSGSSASVLCSLKPISPPLPESRFPHLYNHPYPQDCCDNQNERIHVLRALETAKPRQEETSWSFPQYSWPFPGPPGCLPVSCTAASLGLLSRLSSCRPAFILIWPLLLLYLPLKRSSPLLPLVKSHPSFMAQLKFYFLQGPCPTLDLKKSSLSLLHSHAHLIFHCQHYLTCTVAVLSADCVCSAAAHAWGQGPSCILAEG